MSDVCGTCAFNPPHYQALMERGPVVRLSRLDGRHVDVEYPAVWDLCVGCAPLFDRGRLYDLAVRGYEARLVYDPSLAEDAGHVVAALHAIFTAAYRLRVGSLVPLERAAP